MCPDILKCWRVCFATLLHEELLEKRVTHVLLCNLDELLTFKCFSRDSFYVSFHLSFILTPVFLLLLFLHLPLFTQSLSVHTSFVYSVSSHFYLVSFVCIQSHIPCRWTLRHKYCHTANLENIELNWKLRKCIETQNTYNRKEYCRKNTNMRNATRIAFFLILYTLSVAQLSFTLIILLIYVGV